MLGAAWYSSGEEGRLWSGKRCPAGRCTTDEIDGVILAMEKERENIWDEGKSISLLLFNCRSDNLRLFVIPVKLSLDIGYKPLVDMRCC